MHNVITLNVVILIVLVLSVIRIKWQYTGVQYAKCHNSVCRCAKCHGDQTSTHFATSGLDGSRRVDEPRRRSRLRRQCRHHRRKTDRINPDFFRIFFDEIRRRQGRRNHPEKFC